MRIELAKGFVTERLATDDGYTWTLTTRLGAMLRELEQRYGPRDREWTPLGIEFGLDGPMIWFPGNCRNVSIMLSMAAVEDTNQALFELAQEVIHLLSPQGLRGAPVIERGSCDCVRARVFCARESRSIDFTSRVFGGHASCGRATCN
jgi:hypothetical protein